MRKLGFVVFLSMVIMLMFSGCADVTNIEPCVAEVGAHVYGFWGGLWHGFISPIAWIGSLFSSDIAIYAVSNNGGWYDFGFGLGVTTILGGGGGGAVSY